MLDIKELHTSIDKAFVSTLPRFVFEGKIVVVQSSLEIQKAVDAIYKSTRIVGIDTETRPAFKKGVRHKVALLQVSTDEICFLFRLSMTGLTPELVCLLEDQNILKVGLSLNDDIPLLKERQNFTPNGFVDLQPYVKEMGITDMSLRKLYANVFHKKISKTAQCSNWESDILSPSQKAYAATDAYACLHLFQELSKLRETGEYIIIESENRQENNQNEN